MFQMLITGSHRLPQVYKKKSVKFACLSRTLSNQILDDLLASKALEQATLTAPQKNGPR